MANAKIKGITVEIGGDTTKLGKALSDSENKSKSLQSELSQINKLLKFDPSNTELLAQKQKVLSGAIESTREKLNTLKKAEEQVQEQFKRGEVSEEQVRALQREIISTTSKMESYEKELKDTGKALKNAGDKASEFGEKAKKAGEMAVAGFGAVVTGAGAVVGALAGASVAGAEYADNILTMSTVTGISTDKLQEFSYASELVDVSVETLTKSMAKNIKSMKGAQDGSKAYVETYQKLGVAVTDVNGNLRDGETVYWECIDALGKIENETERDALAMQVFGKSAQELNPLIEAGSEKMKELGEEAHNVGAVMSEESLDALGSFDDSIQRLKGSAGATKNALGGVLLPELQMLTDTGTDLLNDFTTKLNASGGGLEGLVETVESMSGDIADTVSGVIEDLLNGAISILPAIINTVSQIVLTLIPSLATTLLQSVPNILQMLMNVLMQVINSLGTLLPTLLPEILACILSIVDLLIMNLPALISALMLVVMGIVDALPTMLQLLVDRLPEILNTLLFGVLPEIINIFIEILPELITSIVTLLVEYGPQLVETTIYLIGTIIDAIFRSLGDLFTKLGEWFASVVGKIGEWGAEMKTKSGEVVQNVITSVVNFFKELPNKIGYAIGFTIGALIQWGKNIIEWVRTDVPKIIDSVVSWFKNLPSKISSAISSAVDKIGTWCTNMKNKAVSGVKQVVSSVTDGFKNLPKKLTSIGKNIVEGLWKGIKNAKDWLIGKIKSFAISITDGIKEALGIESPSRVMRDEVGKFISEGIGVGITENSDAPLNALDSLNDDMTNQALSLNGATINRKLSATFDTASGAYNDASLMSKLDGIYDRLGRLKMVTDTGALVAEILDKVDAGLAEKQLLNARRV